MKTKLSIVFLLATLLLVSCNKESVKHTYILTNNTGIDGTVFVNECNELNETINIQNATIPKGTSKSFVAVDGAVKVKLYIKDLEVWVQQVFYLNEASTSITIDGSTIVGKQEP